MLSWRFAAYHYRPGWNGEDTTLSGCHICGSGSCSVFKRWLTLTLGMSQLKQCRWITCSGRSNSGFAVTVQLMKCNFWSGAILRESWDLQGSHEPRTTTTLLFIFHFLSWPLQQQHWCSPFKDDMSFVLFLYKKRNTICGNRSVWWLTRLNSCIMDTFACGWKSI